MKKSQIIILGGCLLCCCGVLLSLYALSPISKEIFRADFDRKFLSKSVLTEESSLDIEFNSFYLAGITGNKLYLGNYTAPAHLLVADHSLKDTTHTRLEITGLDSITEPKRFRLSVTRENFYMAHGTLPIILRGKTGQWNAAPFMTDDGYYFAEGEPISNSTFALKSYNTTEKSYELAKKTIDSMQFKLELLNKQIDGIFCVDGKLLIDQKTHNIVYMHYYRNEIVVADTNLNLKYRSHTVDTFSRARIKVSNVNSDGTKSMLSAPPMQLNGIAYADEGKLYIHSNVLARNEVEEYFINDTVIDVYDLENKCAYLYSFYIPSREGHKPSSLIIDGNLIAVIFDRFLVTYRLNDTPPI